MNRIYPYVFKANYSAGSFNLQSLWYTIKDYADVNKIKYYKNKEEDYAIVHVKEWKDNINTHVLVDELLNRNCVVVPKYPLATNKKWIFTPLNEPERKRIFYEEHFKEGTLHSTTQPENKMKC